MTTTDEALTEQIARALALENGYDPDHSCDEWAVDAYRGDAAAVLPIIREAQEGAIKEAVDDFTGGGWHDANDRANIHPDYITRTGMNVVNNWFHEYADRYTEEDW